MAAVEALLTGDLACLLHCPECAAAVALTCRALAEAARREWPRVAVVLSRVASRAVLAVARRDADGLAELARLTTLPVEALREATRLEMFDLVEWFFTVSDAVSDEARADLIRAGREDLLPPPMRPRHIAVLTEDALLLTDEAMDAFLAERPDLAPHRAQLTHERGWGSVICHLLGRPTAERRSVESAERRIRLSRTADVVTDIESASPDYTVEMRATYGDVALTVAPLVVLQYTHIELVFTAAPEFQGPYVARYTTYMLDSNRRRRVASEMLRGDGLLFTGGLVYRLPHA